MSTQDLPPAPMAACQITGKMVPEDELVTISGYRVCAEGKAILLQRLQAGESLPGEYERPRVLQRFGSILLDAIIIVWPLSIVTGLISAATGSFLVGGLVAIVATLIQTAYFAHLHAMRGQTVGKMAGKIMVRNLDGSTVTLKTAYIRAFAYAGPGILGGFALVVVGLVGTSAFWLTQVMNGLVGLWSLVSIIMALTDTAQQRALHDRIAGTRVVQKT